MTETITLQRKLTLDSEFLNKDIKKNILDKLKISTNNECSQDYGYFLNIVKLKSIVDNFISPNCENVFVVEFEVETLKPEVGKKFEGEVCMIFSSGIFLNIQNKLKVLIPTTTLKNYSFNQIENCFIHKKTKKKIKVEDKLTVIISGAKYSKKAFSCFGNLYSEEPEEDAIEDELDANKILETINSKKDLKEWARKNHPDKGGDTKIFQEVYDMAEKKLASKKTKK